MKYKELSESYYFQMLFLHSDPISILSPGLVELPDPSLQKQMHLQWPDDFSTNKHTDSFRCSPLVFNPLFLALKTKCPLPRVAPKACLNIPKFEVRQTRPQMSRKNLAFYDTWFMSVRSISTFWWFQKSLNKKNIKMRIPSKFLEQKW